MILPFFEQISRRTFTYYTGEQYRVKFSVELDTDTDIYYIYISCVEPDNTSKNTLFIYNAPMDGNNLTKAIEEMNMQIDILNKNFKWNNSNINRSLSNFIHQSGFMEFIEEIITNTTVFIGTRTDFK